MHYKEIALIFNIKLIKLKGKVRNFVDIKITSIC